MKKGIKKLIIIGGVVVLLVAGFFIYRGVASAAETNAAFDQEATFDEVTKGDISLSVSGSGNLGSADTFDIDAASYLVIEDVTVAAGDTMAAGDVIATLDTEAMQDKAQELANEVSAAQISIDTTNNVTTSLSIKSPVDGWVKNVVLDEDDYIEDAMSEYGYIALVATEEREIINAASSSLTEGSEVKVKCEGYTYSGVVTNENGTLYVSIDTIYRTVGADAVVYDADGNELFTGKIELAAYQEIESSYGIITDVGFSEDEEIEQGETIYKATQYSLDVQELYDNLADLKSQYETMQSLITAGQITSPGAGVISAVNITDGQECEEGTALISVESTEDWSATVSVDELDINSIEVGQNVNVELDSLPNEVFTGTVTAISDYGTASSGITTYNVMVSVQDDDRFKINMTLSCEILAQEATDALLVPVDDVLTTGNTSYVMVKVDRTEAEIATIKQLILNEDYDGLKEYMGVDATTLGISMLSDPSQLINSEVRAVETGIESAYYIQITSGLSEGEYVLAQESDSSSDEGFFMQGMGEIMGGNVQSGQMPEGGSRPQGGSMPGGN